MRFITSLRQPTLKQNSFFGHLRFAMITKPAIQLTDCRSKNCFLAQSMHLQDHVTVIYFK